jgi:hypothetical protein
MASAAQTGRRRSVGRAGAVAALIGAWLGGFGAATVATAAQARPSAEPIVLVPGYLWQVAGEPDKLRAQLLESGFDERDIFLVGYPERETPDVIGAVVADALLQALAFYPAGTKARVVTWSLGHFVALYSILEHGLEDRVASVVGIAGAAHGTERDRLCSLGLCGRTLPLLMPAHNEFVRSVYAAKPGALASLSKCALFSPEDGVLEPYDSGAFPDGVNVEVRGVKHLQKFKDRSYVDAMLERCW